MDVFVLIALIVVIIFLYNIRNSQKTIAAQNEKDFSYLKKLVQDLKKGVAVTEEKKWVDKPATEDAPSWRPKPIIPFQEKLNEPDLLIPEKKIPEEKQMMGSPLATDFKATPTQPAKPFIPIPRQESWSQRWLKNNPDLEKFIGENLVNKIGITVLVLGIAFFVKYAIDQEWINEVGRVCIGIACGIAMIAVAHYMRNSYRSFSSVMAGGGIAVFYFTIAFAYHQYQLFPQIAAFVIMMIITVFAVALSLLYDKIELAVIALVGGFLAPFLVSSGSGNYVILFSYLLILSSGILIIAYYKRWSLLIALSFFFSWLIFDAWLLKDYAFGGKILPYKNALLFSTAFYFLFLVTAMINNLRTQKPFKAFDYSLLLAITFSYYAQGMYILSGWNDAAYQGVFTMALGFVNFGVAWYLFKSQKAEKNLLYLLIGLTLTFISLVAPVQLRGHSITLFWSAECVLLYWLHQRSGIKIFRLSSLLILFCMALSLMLDWSLAGEKSEFYLPLIFTSLQGIVTNIAAIVSLALYSFLLSIDHKKGMSFFTVKADTAMKIFAGAAIVLLYITCLFGVNLFFKYQESFTVPNAYHQLITYVFAITAIKLLGRRKEFAGPIFPLVITAGCLVFYFCSTGLANGLVTGITLKEYGPAHAIVHWLSVVALLYLLFDLTVVLRKHAASTGKKILWAFCIAALAFFSIECRLLYLSIFANENTLGTYESLYSKAGLTIIWAIFSFFTIWVGLSYKNKILRIIALSIFTVALLKLFLFDIRNISEAGKIAAFIMLGVLLLVISFMYQRLKKIIINNERKED